MQPDSSRDTGVGWSRLPNEVAAPSDTLYNSWGVLLLDGRVQLTIDMQVPHRRLPAMVAGAAPESVQPISEDAVAGGRHQHLPGQQRRG